MKLLSEKILGSQVFLPDQRSMFHSLLLHVTDDVMERVQRDHCMVLQVPRDIPIPRVCRILVRNLTGKEFAPSTMEHWGVHVGNHRVRLIARGCLL